MTDASTLQVMLHGELIGTITRVEGEPENEYSMMTLARILGMDVPAIELVNVDVQFADRQR